MLKFKCINVEENKKKWFYIGGTWELTLGDSWGMDW